VRRFGALGTLQLIDGDGAVPGMNRADAFLWRERIGARVSMAHPEYEPVGVQVLVPGDSTWPAALDDLGARAPLALWVRGDVSHLAGSVSERGR